MLKDPLAAQILAVLFVAKEPVPLLQLHQVFPETSSRDLARLMKELAEEFNSVQDSVEIRAGRRGVPDEQPGAAS